MRYIFKICALNFKRRKSKLGCVVGRESWKMLYKQIKRHAWLSWKWDNSVFGIFSKCNQKLVGRILNWNVRVQHNWELWNSSL